MSAVKRDRTVGKTSLTHRDSFRTLLVDGEEMLYGCIATLALNEAEGTDIKSTPHHNALPP